MMSDLVEFLRARLAEDEAVARAAIDPDRPGVHWEWVTIETDVSVKPGEEECALEEQVLSLRTVEHFPSKNVEGFILPSFVIHREDGSGNPKALQHIARHDPARVLREVEAKRQIVDLHGSGIDPCDAHDGATLETVDCETMQALASAYSDHPDYRDEWKP